MGVCNIDCVVVYNDGSIGFSLAKVSLDNNSRERAREVWKIGRIYGGHGEKDEGSIGGSDEREKEEREGCDKNKEGIRFSKRDDDVNIGDIYKALNVER